MELKDIVLKKGDIVYFADNSWQIIRERENDKTFGEAILPYITANKIYKIERPVKYKTIYEAPKELLTKEEKEYLEAVIRPFKNKIERISKRWDVHEHIKISYYDDMADCYDYIVLPFFTKDTMYKGMEPDKEYTLKELGLFEEE